ncbi:hypothetical protein G9A89_022704 [Geosiphon pyriformis]|nr:hypothetical protein G9A89_022704 [Geosiphon pyriformis]
MLRQQPQNEAKSTSNGNIDSTTVNTSTSQSLVRSSDTKNGSSWENATNSDIGRSQTFELLIPPALADFKLPPNFSDHLDTKLQFEHHEKLVAEIKTPDHELNYVDEFQDNSHVPKLAYRKLFLMFMNYGGIAWGGPAAEISRLKDDLVVREKWITLARFNRVFSVYQILPGPEATEIAMFFGYLSAGRIGGIVAGLGFLLPGFLLLLLASYGYLLVGLENKYFNASFRALQPIIAAMVMRAVHKLADHAFISSKTKKFSYWLFSLAVIAAIQSTLNINLFLTLGILGLIYMTIDRKFYWLSALILLLEIVGFTAFVFFEGFPSATSIGIGISKTTDPGHIFGLGLLAGSLSFGGAYTTIPFIQAEAVTIGKWLTEKTFLDAIAIGNVIPSPLTMFSTFIGFQAGNKFGGLPYAFLEATLITIGIFLPCFTFTIMGHDFLERLVRNRFLAAFFDGISASVVGVVAITALKLLKSSVTSSITLKNMNEQERSMMAVVQDSVSSILYMMSLGALYKFNGKHISLYLEHIEKLNFLICKSKKTLRASVRID